MEKAKFYEALQRSGCKPAILAQLPSYHTEYVVERLPKPLTELFNSEYEKLTWNELINKAKAAMSDLHILQSQVWHYIMFVITTIIINT